MKKVFFLTVAFFAGFAVMAQQPSANQIIKVTTDKYDFGKIKQNVPVTTLLDVTNISDKPVVVEKAWAGCGCTTPEITKEPIGPNTSAKLKIGYNAAAMGHFDKIVFVQLAGVAEPKQIVITGEVVDAAAYDAYVKSDEYKKLNAPKEKTVTKTESKNGETKTVIKQKKNGKKDKKKEKSTASGM